MMPSSSSGDSNNSSMSDFSRILPGGTFGSRTAIPATDFSQPANSADTATRTPAAQSRAPTDLTVILPLSLMFGRKIAS